MLNSHKMKRQVLCQDFLSAVRYRVESKYIRPSRVRAGQITALRAHETLSCRTHTGDAAEKSLVRLSTIAALGLLDYQFSRTVRGLPWTPFGAQKSPVYFYGSIGPETVLRTARGLSRTWQIEEAETARRVCIWTKVHCPVPSLRHDV